MPFFTLDIGGLAKRLTPSSRHGRRLLARSTAFGAPKTQAGVRVIPLSDSAVALMTEWRAHARSDDAESLVFSTHSGKPISPNNVLRRWVFPAAEAIGIRRGTWLTFRPPYSSWAHARGVPGKVIAALMGHAKVHTTLKVYTQVLDDSLRIAADKVGSELFTIRKNRAR